MCPEFRHTTFDEVAGLLLEHRVLVRHRNELVIAEALRIGDERQSRLACLAEFTDHKRFVELFKAVSNSFRKIKTNERLRCSDTLLISAC